MPLRRLACIFIGLLLAGPASAGDPLRDDFDLGRFTILSSSGLEPFADAAARLLQDAQGPWRWGIPSQPFVTTIDEDGDKRCHPAGAPDVADFIKDGAPDVYARALTLHTAGRPEADTASFEAWILLMVLSSTEGFDGLDGSRFSGDNQCVLDLATSIPVWIAAAELLEARGAFTPSDRLVFSRWLASKAYPLVAWAGRVRRNNWGAAGSLSARMIARYVEPFVPVLVEQAPTPRAIFPSDAVREHDRIQLDRMGTSWRGDSRCPVHGIQPHGGIPDELRRGGAGCRGTALPSGRDRSLGYQTMHVELLALHAEVMRVEGDDALYELRTQEGDPALLQAMLFVIDNPAGGPSWSWGVRTGALRVANRYYRDPRLREQIEANASLGFRGGRILPYTRIYSYSEP